MFFECDADLGARPKTRSVEQRIARFDQSDLERTAVFAPNRVGAIPARLSEKVLEIATARKLGELVSNRILGREDELTLDFDKFERTENLKRFGDLLLEGGRDRIARLLREKFNRRFKGPAALGSVP